MAALIAVANTKGGVGKSTITGNLACAFCTAHPTWSVLVVDADPQASLTKWFDLGTESPPFERLQLTTARVLQQQVAKLRQRYDAVLIDCPPMQSDITAAAVAQADLALIPVQPSPLDVLAYSDLVPLLRQASTFNVKLQLRFLVNQLSAGTVLGSEVLETFADADIPMLQTHIHDRQAYRRVVAHGTSVFGYTTADADARRVFAQANSARNEITALAREVLHVIAA